MTLKILHFIESGGLYGAESVILNLSREMQAGGKYTPVVGCIVSHPEDRSDLYDKAFEFGIAAEKLVLRNSFLFVDIPRVARQLKRIGISLIHSHGYKPSVFGFLIKLLTGIPITSTCHLWFLQGKLPLKLRVMVRLELLFYKFFPIVIAVSEPIKRFLVNSGVDGKIIQVIKNGIVLEDYCPVAKTTLEKLRRELKLNENKFCILNVARLSRQKVQWHIITSAEKLRATGIDVTFLIVGEGELKTELLQQINRKNLDKTVQLLGFRHDIKELLQLADLFILPSLDEGMPMSLLEAVASRTPVLTTPVGDIPKLIKDGKSGVLVNVDDASDLAKGIMHFVNSRETSQKLAETAWSMMKEIYSSGAMYQQYHAIYDHYFKCK